MAYSVVLGNTYYLLPFDIFVVWTPALGCKLNDSRDFVSFVVFFDWHRIGTPYVLSE